MPSDAERGQERRGYVTPRSDLGALRYVLPAYGNLGNREAQTPGVSQQSTQFRRSNAQPCSAMLGAMAFHATERRALAPHCVSE